LIVGVAVPAISRGQAPPGPIVATPPAAPSSRASTAAPAVKQEAPRKTLAGAWKLNRDESDNSERRAQGGNGGGNGPSGGNGPYGGNEGRRRGGIGFPGGQGGNGPYGRGRGGNGENEQERQAMMEIVRPPASWHIDLKDQEFDFSDEQGRKSVFLTDGRKTQKSKDAHRVEISARWDGTRLVSDEKGPGGAKLSRTFELSADGLQLDETISIDNGRSNFPMTLRYVYDAAPDQGRQ